MIPIFKHETEAGLTDTIQSKGSFTYASNITTAKLPEEEADKLTKMLDANAEANPNQIDLFYLESILASVGWNANDDVFDSQEVWAARRTPVDKQFNFMHNETDIIGHLTSSRIVDQEGKVIATTEDLPNQFDIVVGSVLYRKWSSPDLQERMDQIIAEIQADKWCVSMECLFRNFDYAIVTPDGTHKVLARDDDSSFLTKHLRVYGGTGEFEGNKVGRLLRGFSFSGKGLVDRPANPRSRITSINDKKEISAFVGAAATIKDLKISNPQEFTSMTISQEKYDALQAQTKALEVQLVEANASKIVEAQKELDDAKAKTTELEASVASVTSELEASKEVAKAKDESIDSFKAELETAKTELSEANDKLAAQELEAIKATRKAMLLEKVDEARADALVEKFAAASPEMFEALVESLPAKFPPEKDEDKDKDKEKKKKDKKSDASDVTDEVADTDLDDATASEDADMTSGGDDAPGEIRAKAASWFGTSVFRTTAKQEEGE